MCGNFKHTNCNMARYPLLINEVDYQCKGIETKYEHLESNVAMDVAHCAMEGNIYNSIVLTNILGVCYWTSCSQDGNSIYHSVALQGMATMSFSQLALSCTF